MNSKAITLLKRMLKAKKLSLSLLIAIIVFVFSFNQVSSFNQSFTTFLAQKNLEKELTGKVSKVIDGDTIELLAKTSKENPYNHIAKLKIRLYGIDAPEKKQEFGIQAKNYLSSLIFNEEVKIIVENQDKYGRLVGTIYFNNKDINKEMVKNGYAWAYEEYSTKYLAHQADAQMFKLGLFKDENAIKPSEFRKAIKKG
ncbi:thermonuclease [Campylobacter helveticus]|uniref:thermonuclease family protein n=1 Tax=Campylobacter helveticus TaxID=28898 RepID=UPI00111761C3|nr:thermonuclease family protein [Campylobacter helveticus]TNH36295.1 thermonuclease [Campylobacter helveticus]